MAATLYPPLVFDAAAQLIESIDWESTPQGEEYWAQVMRNLVELAEAATCFEEGPLEDEA